MIFLVEYEVHLQLFRGERYSLRSHCGHFSKWLQSSPRTNWECLQSFKMITCHKPPLYQSWRFNQIDPDFIPYLLEYMLEYLDLNVNDALHSCKYYCNTTIIPHSKWLRNSTFSTQTRLPVPNQRFSGSWATWH